MRIEEEKGKEKQIRNKIEDLIWGYGKVKKSKISNNKFFRQRGFFFFFF